ncbi:MAG TPA: hypothetical protein DEP47_07220, partial [Chloroflexi bacterium]|nr:hypothetical protein [Chloroflexota bacterium]
MLKQEPDIPDDQTIWQVVRTAVPEIGDVEQKMSHLEKKMGDPAIYEDPKTLAKVLSKHERLLADYERLDGSRYESRLEAALSRLGFAEDSWDQPVGQLSGGQKKLVLLARLSVQQPKLLLLDEPDNHLDLTAKRHLERFINGYKGCVVIISHDRYLLDEVATHIAELENGRLTLYHGNYSAYSAEREIRRLR